MCHEPAGYAKLFSLRIANKLHKEKNGKRCMELNVKLCKTELVFSCEMYLSGLCFMFKCMLIFKNSFKFVILGALN